MSSPLRVLPIVPAQPPSRPPQSNIPATTVGRRAIQEMVKQYLSDTKLVPPVPMEDLKKLTETLLREKGIDAKFLDFSAVLLNNELWREGIAAVPYNRRLLLLPKCLRVEEHCPAPFDELGLLCKRCGMCSIQDLQDEAERLGYAVLVAEGSPIVMALIETGKIEAIVGVSCLSVLERAFPYMEAAAIPGVAIPLLQDDCVDTSVDLDAVWDVIQLTADDRTRRMDLGALKDEVMSWFARAELEKVLGKPEGPTDEIALDWLAREGKRWRPFLTTAVRQALQVDPEKAPEEALPLDLRRVAIAVECFHKASLIHDDIEDMDAQRYGEKTLHEEHGIPVALNVGDYLIGEGYRLLAECEASPETRAAMLKVAAEGHRTLSRGQGTELSWANDPKPLTPLEVLEIFRQKTAPAFEVALRLGSIYAGSDEEVRDVIETFSRALGIAYQIRDDVNDLAESEEPSDVLAMRPTLPLAVAYERAKGVDKDLLASLWNRTAGDDLDLAEVLTKTRELGAEERSRELLEAYKEEAIRSLWALENPGVKGLLRRVIGKIFNETQIKGWCNEFEARNAPGREAGTAASA